MHTCAHAHAHTLGYFCATATVSCTATYLTLHTRHTLWKINAGHADHVGEADPGVYGDAGAQRLEVGEDRGGGDAEEGDVVGVSSSCRKSLSRRHGGMEAWRQ